MPIAEMMSFAKREMGYFWDAHRGEVGASLSMGLSAISRA